MHRLVKKISLILLLVLWISTTGVGIRAAAENQPVIHALLFYSPDCAHCHKVMTEDLPPLVEQYGEQLQIIIIDVSTQEGFELYKTAIEAFKIPQERIGVPTLVVGALVMVGSLEIPQYFPGIIADGLENGGIGWPEIPGLEDILLKEGLVSTERSELSVTQRYMLDPVGNTLSVIVLVFMAATVAGVIYQLRSKAPAAPEGRSKTAVWRWTVPLLSLFGIAIAAYLSYIEVSQVEAICGPVGDCNTVQQSSYATLFGVISVGLLGLAGYAAMLLAWLVYELGPPTSKGLAALALWAMALVGTLFSIYLTFLEPFVIGATCIWCISSSIIMTLLLWVTTPQAIKVWNVKQQTG